MILINFSHPITKHHREEIAQLIGRPIGSIIEVKTHFNSEISIAEQMRLLIDSIALTAEEWQTEELLINLPSLSIGAAALLAELHGRCGYFPAVVRWAPIENSLPPQFEAIEIVNLQGIRNQAREKR
ncbi:MAG: hypothetical protein KF868_08135 [Acidobacteria bacterium]|nr:hypothetical protein [Acidobacteriota bacterium]MCW5971341.1 hypothetical protein [Blastocatellales bacterium]